jgi:hypothetical protein
MWLGTTGLRHSYINLKYFAGGKNFNTIFYRLLTCLLLVQTCYIVFTLTNLAGLWNKTNDNFEKAFAMGLYPLPSLMLLASTFLTTILARHRFRAAVSPLEYFIAWKNVNASGNFVSQI